MGVSNFTARVLIAFHSFNKYSNACNGPGIGLGTDIAVDRKHSAAVHREMNSSEGRQWTDEQAKMYQMVVSAVEENEV